MKRIVTVAPARKARSVARTYKRPDRDAMGVRPTGAIVSRSDAAALSNGIGRNLAKRAAEAELAWRKERGL